MEASQVTPYRSNTMRLGFIAQDLPHLQFAAHRTAKLMSKPIIGGFNRLKRVARFLSKHPRWAVQYGVQEMPVKLVIRADSDWAGDLIDRKSTSSVHVIWGKHLIKSVVAGQATQALSSTEAEFLASVKGGSVGIGIRSMITDFGGTVKYMTRETDSSG